MAARVLVCDEDQDALRWCCSIIRGSGRLHLVGAESCPQGLPSAVRELGRDLDVVVVGCRPLTVPDVDELVRGLNPWRSLVLSDSMDDPVADAVVVAAVRAGARGYMSRHPPVDQLLLGIEVVADGGVVFCPPVAKRLSWYFSRMRELPGLEPFPELSSREREILELIALGMGNQEIARRLVVAEKTVRNHITRIFVKLGVQNRTSAAVRARDAGLGVGRFKAS